MKSTRQQWVGRPVVYRCYDESGRLIYIGSTSSMWDRLTQHRYDTWWTPLLAKLRMQVFPTIEAARAAERVAILHEEPAFNVRPRRRNWDELYSTLGLADLAMWRRWVHRDRETPWPMPGWQERRLRSVA